MTSPDEMKSVETPLRAMAEAELASRPVDESVIRPSTELLYELQVHQIELEMQNEALRRQQAELEASRDRYVDLYDFAPVGYLTLDANGMIEELNLTAAKLLGTERKDLLHRSLKAQVPAEDQPRWTALFMRLKAGAGKGTVEMALQRRDGTVFQAQLDCECRLIREVGADRTPIRIALTDISRRKAAEAALKQQIDELERFNHAAIDREIAMIELKRQVNALSRELGRAPPFVLDFADTPFAGAPQ